VRADQVDNPVSTGIGDDFHTAFLKSGFLYFVVAASRARSFAVRGWFLAATMAAPFGNLGAGSPAIVPNHNLDHIGDASVFLIGGHCSSSKRRL